MSKIVIPIGQLDSKISKEEIIELGIENASEIILTGQYDLLKVYIELRRYELYLKTVVEEIKKSTIEIAKNEGMKDFEYGTAKILFTSRKKYDYSSDEEWDKIADEMNLIKTAKTAREKLLKSIDGEFIEVLDEETGELKKINAPSVEVVESLILRL